jgi:cell fate regulator YaaT (PSP1 superfamily)
MTTIAGVRFRAAGRVYYYTADTALAVGDRVVAETERGLDLGWVVIAPDQVLASELPEPPPAIVRLAQPADLQGPTGFRTLAADDLERARERVRHHGLPLTLVAAAYSLDGSRLLIDYTTERPVDARELVRDLAGIFRTRIALRRLDAPDAARPLGALGRVGLARGAAGPPALASVEGAPEQDVPLAPGRPAGLFGRLLRGLSAENEQYLAAKERLPHLGQTVETPTGPGVVIEVKVLPELVTVRLADGALVQLSGPRLEPAPPATIAAEEHRAARGRRGRRARRPTADGPSPPNPAEVDEAGEPDTSLARDVKRAPTANPE